MRSPRLRALALLITIACTAAVAEEQSATSPASGSTGVSGGATSVRPAGAFGDAPAVPRAVRPAAGSVGVSGAREYSIRELFEAAASHDAEVARSRLELQGARLDVEDARSARLPTVRAEASGSLIGNPLDPVSLTAGELGTVQTLAGDIALPPEDVRIFDGMEGTQYEIAVTIEQPVYTWGKIPATIEVAEAAVLARGVAGQVSRRDLAARLRTQVHSLAILSETGALLNQQKELAEQLVRISEESLRSGFIIRADVLEARVRAAEVDLALRQVANRTEELLVDMRSRTGIADLTVEEAAAPKSPELSDFPIPDREAAISSALNNNLELSLASAQESLRRAQARSAEAGGILRPDIGLQIRLSYSGPRFPIVETDWYGSNSGNLVGSLGLRTTVYDAGRTRRGEESARTQVRRAQTDINAAAQTLERSVASDILTMELAAERHEYYELLAESASEQARLKRAQADAGASGETEYIVEEIEALGHRIAALGELSTYVAAALRIEAAGATADEIAWRP